MIRFILPILIFCVGSVHSVFSQSQYEGFGGSTKGGKDKAVVHVKNLEAHGPGSLYDAIGSNRTVVFDVAGTIEHFRWDSSDGKDMAVSNLTIDGSTAPAPGITLDNKNNGNCLSFQDGCHDIIVKNIRVRNAGNDGLSVVNAHDVVFDHVSSSGNRDGGLDITAGAYNITVQWSIFGPVSAPSSGPMLIAYTPTRNISIHHNLFNSRGAATEGARNPLVHSSNGKPATMMADIRNNIIWNWGNSNREPCCGYGYGTGVDHDGTANIINNFYQTNGSESATAIDFNHEAGKARGYVAGNVFGNKGVNGNKLNNLVSPWAAGNVKTDDACVAAAKVLAQAGPRPLDATDLALINEVSLANCPVNQLPIVNAGKDIILSPSQKEIVLNATANDPDGRIVSYQWSKIKGPGVYTLHNTNRPAATISKLTKGIYVFRLTVTDDRNGTAVDDVTITVIP